QSFLFRVPTGEDNGSVRLPALLQQFADSVYRFEHRRRAAVGIDSAIDPGVAMIPEDDQLVWIFVSRNSADDIPNRPIVIILLEMHFDTHRSRSNVIGEWQRTLPFTRGLRAPEILQNRRSVAVREWRGWNFRHVRSLRRRNSLRIGQRWQRRNSWSGGIAGVLEHVLNGATLHCRFRTPWALGIGIALEVTIVPGIGIDDHAGRTVLFSDETLYATKI